MILYILISHCVGLVGAFARHRQIAVDRPITPKELGFRPTKVDIDVEADTGLHGRKLYTQDYALFTSCGSRLSAAKAISEWYEGLVANSCYLCTNNDDGTRQSCKYTLTESGSTLTSKFEAFSDTACSANVIEYIDDTLTAGECSYSSSYVVSLHSDVSDVLLLVPEIGYKEIEYASSSCNGAPVAFENRLFIADACSGDDGAGGSSMVTSCDGSRLLFNDYETTDCSGVSTKFYIALGTCIADTIAHGFQGFANSNSDDDQGAVHETAAQDKICTSLSDDEVDLATAILVIIIIVVVVCCCVCGGGGLTYGIIYYQMAKGKSPWLQKHKPADGHTRIAVEGDEADQGGSPGAYESAPPAYEENIPVVKAVEIP